jgi:hypothetical protein
MSAPHPTPPRVLHRMEASLEAVDTESSVQSPESRALYRSLSEPRGRQCICVPALGSEAESMAKTVERCGSVALGCDVLLRRASCVRTHSCVGLSREVDRWARPRLSSERIQSTQCGRGLRTYAS